MSYTYDDLIAQFRGDLRDPATLNNKFFIDTEILEWIIDGNMEMARELGSHMLTTNLSLVASTRTYANPTNVTKIVEIRDSNNEKIIPTTISVLDSFDSLWMDKEGDVQYWYPLNETGSSTPVNIGFFKTPSANETVVVKAWKLPKHTGMDGASDSPEVDTFITKLIMDYVRAQGYHKKGDYSRHDILINKFYNINIPMAKKFVHREEDRLLGMRSNEKQTNMGVGRLPDGYPVNIR